MYRSNATFTLILSIQDCGDGSDELNCTLTTVCNKNEFICANGRCILQEWRCDNEFDCDDFSDEMVSSFAQF